MNSLVLQAIVLVPLAGAYVQFGYAARGSALKQSLPQQLSKQMMIAVPTPLLVQGDEEQVGVLDVFQGFLP